MKLTPKFDQRSPGLIVGYVREPDWATADGSVVLYRGDCLEILPTLAGVDAVVTDPPYGIGFQSHYQDSIDYGPIAGDDTPFDPSPWLHFADVILWGGNNFADRLPVGGWICWDKRLSAEGDKMLGSPFELAWCSRRNLFRMVRLLHGGAKNADARNGDVANGKRFHPTQKPVRLMEACVGYFPKAEAILDPYMGSGSTGLACIRTGRRFIGIELDHAHFATACERITEELKRLSLLEPVPQIIQRSLLKGGGP